MHIRSWACRVISIRPHDQEQVERTAAMQPDLRAIDAYNPQERLVEWVRSHGVTTMHTGHGPGVLVSGQTMIVKSRGRTVDEAVMVPQAMIAVTIGESAREATKGPGTRAKMVALLRTELIKAQEYDRKRETAAEDKKPARDLRLEALARVLKREVPLLVTVQRAQDIMSALRVAKEFNVQAGTGRSCGSLFGFGSDQRSRRARHRAPHHGSVGWRN